MFSIIYYSCTPYTDSTGKGFFNTYKYGICNLLLTLVSFVFIFGIYKKYKITGCDIHVHVECRRNILKWDHIDIDLIPYRSYKLFTTLAGVRSYSNKNIPISEPKGLPNYISNETKQDFISMFGDAHSTSWLTLAEIKEYNNKKPKIFKSGLVDEEGAKAIEQGIAPEWYCQCSNNNSYVFREWAEDNNTLQPIIEKLEKIKIERGILSDNHIRIVFWFDN